MKLFLIISTLLLLLIFGAFFWMAQSSKKVPELGLFEGSLHSCILSSNCVSSTAQDIAAIALLVCDEQTWKQMPELLLAMGGQLQRKDDAYIWVTFESRWFSFVDDLELQWDVSAGQCHVRSASRVGRSDFGVNRQRVESLRGRMVVPS